ncbi:C39 family peptidase [Treponema sp. Marseille-Q4523]|uniref:C39 family peptidase n=1 Tax=Treponema TaxID=157 RepID=UPI001EF43CB9|nr:C39 family peptidase [Treponema sp. Marseille-Q4523]
MHHEISRNLPLDADLLYRQTLNNCGPYSVMAVINILKNEKISPELLASEISWRIYKNLTFPRGVVKLLNSYAIKTKEYVLKNKTEKEKIRWLQQTVDKGFPVIVLIKVHHIQHYVTVLGYDENGFMLYDSLQEKNIENPRKTVIDKKCRSGNRYYSYEEFLDLWDSGGYKLFFRNWAAVCSL